MVEVGQPAGGRPLPAYPAAAPEPVSRVGASPVRLLVAGLVVVLLIAGAGVVAHAATEPAGAATPEAAVTDLFAAISDRDVLAVFGSLSPAERRALQPGLEELVGELQRLEVLDDFSLGDVPGFEIELDADDLETHELDDDIVAVTFSGEFEGEAVGEDLPLGRFVDELVDEYDAEDPAEWEDDTDESFEDVTLVAVEEAGRWYISLGYSIAENARLDAGADEPDFGDAIEPEGGATPEEAVELLVEAVADLDVEDMIALLPPDEMAPLYDYAPLFLDDTSSGTDSPVNIDDLQLESEGHGETRRVRATAFEVSIDDGYSTTTASFDGECLRIEDGYEDDLGLYSSAPLGFPVLCGDDADDEGDDVTSMLTPSIPLDPSLLAVTTVSVDGRWYVSPTRTLLDGVTAVVAQVDAEELSALAESWASVFLFGTYATASYLDPYVYDDYGYEDEGYEDEYEPNPELDDALYECDLIYEEAYEAEDSGELTDAELDDLYDQLDAEYDECVAAAEEQYGD